MWGQPPSAVRPKLITCGDGRIRPSRERSERNQNRFGKLLVRENVFEDLGLSPEAPKLKTDLQRARKDGTATLLRSPAPPALPTKNGHVERALLPAAFDVSSCHSNRSRSERDGAVEEPAFVRRREDARRSTRQVLSSREAGRLHAPRCRRNRLAEEIRQRLSGPCQPHSARAHAG